MSAGTTRTGTPATFLPRERGRVREGAPAPTNG